MERDGMNQEEGMINAAGKTGCDELRDLLPAYVLGAADPDERARFEAEIAGCPELAEEWKTFAEMTDAMLLSVPQLEAPARLHDAILRATAPASKAARLGFWERVAQQFFGPQTRLAGALAAISLLILVVSNLLWLNANNALRQERDQLAAQNTFENGLLRELGMGALQRVDLVSETVESAAAGLGWVPVPDGERWVAWFTVQNFPVLKPGKTYQLWLVREEENPISVGIFTVDEAGSGALVFEITEPIGSFDNVGVTEEPAGGSPAPTGAPVVVGEI